MNSYDIVWRYARNARWLSMQRCLHFQRFMIWYKYSILSDRGCVDCGSEIKMYCRMNKCCFCCSLRWGIILFAYINVILFQMFTLFAATCLVMTTELHHSSIINDTSLEMITATVLFAILGMGVILNVLLLVAGYQKDIQMLKLYNYYAVATTLAALIPTFILLSRLRVAEVCAAAFAIVMQCYVVLLVRSEILKLEQKQMRRTRERAPANDTIVVVPDTTYLI